MDRRLFLRSLFIGAGVLAVTTTLPDIAHAMPAAEPFRDTPVGNAPSAAVATPEDIEAARLEDIQYGWRRRRRRVYFRRRRYGYRRRYFRRRYRRRYYR